MRLILFFMLPCYLLAQSMNDFRGLIGTWKQEDKVKQKVGFEYWKFEDDAYIGHSYTFTAGKKTFEENMRIAKKDNAFYYSVSTPGNDTVVHFQCNPQLLKDGFVFENYKHDFPKFIEYHLDSTAIHALVGDSDYKINFKFTKLVDDSISIMSILSQMQLEYYLNQFSKIADHYSHDAIIQGGNTLVKGHEAIVNYWNTFQQGTWKLETDWLKIDGMNAEQRGRSTITYINGSKDKVEYLLKWKKVSEKWVISHDGYW